MELAGGRGLPRLGCALVLSTQERAGRRNKTANTQAKRVCLACPVRKECLNAALSMREPYGIWGGTTPEDRAGLPHEPAIS